MEISAQELRGIIENEIAPTIKWIRISRKREFNDEVEVDEEDIDSFTLSNPFFDPELVHHLIDPGLLGFEFNKAKIYGNWLLEFIEKVRSWAKSNSWLNSPKITFVNDINFVADEIELWEPQLIIPLWLEKTPSYILIASKILKEGRYLSEMHWRDFEKLIGDLLESQDWKVEVTRGSKDGGIDIIAIKQDVILGEIKSIWQAKKYSNNNKVSLKDVRELSALRDSENATKGIIVTTSSLTKGAIDWISKDLYRLAYKDKNQIEDWVLAKKIFL